MPLLRNHIVAVYVVRPTFGGIEFLLLQRPEGHRFTNAWQTVSGYVEESDKAKPLGKPRCASWMKRLACLSSAGIGLTDWRSSTTPTNDTIYFVPAFIALVAANVNLTLSDEHQAFCWLSAQDAAAAVDWTAMRESILFITEALADPMHPGLCVTAFDPIKLPN